MNIEARRIQALQRMKLIPLLLLAVMALVFIATLPLQPAWAGYVNAFAEAAMIGALADWFAVTALFRHPMGLPIPHTAIIPRRKDEIGESMADFVAENFLQQTVIQQKLTQVGLANLLVEWLNNPEIQQRLSRFFMRSLNWLVGALNERSVQRFISRVSERQIEQLPLADWSGKILQALVKENRHQALLTDILRRLIVLINDHRQTIRIKVAEGSPWWLPGFVDDKIVAQMLERIETLLFAMSLDPEHEMRGQFDQYVMDLAHALQHDPVTQAKFLRLQKQMAGNQQLQHYLLRLWKDVSGWIKQQTEETDGAWQEAAQRLIQNVAAELAGDPDMREYVERWLRDALTTAVVEYRRPIASVISDTVKSWDAETTTQRVELAIGKDLQYIRINGTLVGGLIGLLIHAFKHYF